MFPSLHSPTGPAHSTYSLHTLRPPFHPFIHTYSHLKNNTQLGFWPLFLTFWLSEVVPNIKQTFPSSLIFGILAAVCTCRTPVAVPKAVQLLRLFCYNSLMSRNKLSLHTTSQKILTYSKFSPFMFPPIYIYIYIEYLLAHDYVLFTIIFIAPSVKLIL